jgi:hypothetical protein
MVFGMTNSRSRAWLMFRRNTDITATVLGSTRIMRVVVAVAFDVVAYGGER